MENTKLSYLDFLKSKIKIAPESGLDIEIPLIEFQDGTKLKPHQRDAINWAIKGGRRALFESFGLGKTIQQLLIEYNILRFVGGSSQGLRRLAKKMGGGLELKLAFEQDYIVLGNSRDKVKQLGNAVTPPVMEWILERGIETFM